MPNYRLRVGALNALPGAPGTVVTLGTQSLYDYLGVVRTALYGDLTAADARLKDRSLALSYCGATIWRGKLAFPVLGGHGDSFDDGGYAFDLTTRTWETIINPTTEGSSSATVDAYGEWTGGAGGRPEHGRVRLRIHHREHALRPDAQPARPGAHLRRLVRRRRRCWRGSRAAARTAEKDPSSQAS